MISDSLDIWQRLTGELEDIGCSANKHDEKLREFITRDSAPLREEPLPHDDEDEHALMKSQDPVVGTAGNWHLVQQERRDGVMSSSEP